jgi:hypothetical protein
MYIYVLYIGRIYLYRVSLKAYKKIKKNFKATRSFKDTEEINIYIYLYIYTVYRSIKSPYKD